jgi:predicted TIM-barrel fold metal-dependent hydrolase
MLLDINTYVGHWPFKQLKYNTCASLVERMDKFGVDISVVSNLHGVFYKNTQSANEELYQEIRTEKRFNDRLIPFAIINPIYAGWKDDFKTSTEKMGMRGIRLYPLYHDYELTEPACIELVKMARDRNLPVAFSLRIVDSRQRSWMDLEKEWALIDVLPIIREVPDARYWILNVANSTKLSDEETAILKNTDLLFDTSGRSMNDLPELLETYGKNKFAFGTHSPILDYLTGLLRIEALREKEITEEGRDLIRSGNAGRMLGL